MLQKQLSKASFCRTVDYRDTIGSEPRLGTYCCWSRPIAQGNSRRARLRPPSSHAPLKGKPVILCTTGILQRRSRWTRTLRGSQIRLRRRHLKLPSQRLFNWTGSPPCHRSFALRGRLRSPGSSRRLGLMTGLQSSRPSRLCWCRSPSSLCHHRATSCGQQTNSLPHPTFTRFTPTSSTSIHSRGAGQGQRSITFTIPFLVWD